MSDEKKNEKASLQRSEQKRLNLHSFIFADHVASIKFNLIPLTYVFLQVEKDQCLIKLLLSIALKSWKTRGEIRTSKQLVSNYGVILGMKNGSLHATQWKIIFTDKVVVSKISFLRKYDFNQDC